MHQRGQRRARREINLSRRAFGESSEHVPRCCTRDARTRLPDGLSFSARSSSVLGRGPRGLSGLRAGGSGRGTVLRALEPPALLSAVRHWGSRQRPWPCRVSSAVWGEAVQPRPSGAKARDCKNQRPIRSRLPRPVSRRPTNASRSRQPKPLRPSECLSPRRARSGKLRPPPQQAGASEPFLPLSLVWPHSGSWEADGRSPAPSPRWVRPGRVTEALHDQDRN